MFTAGQFYAHVSRLREAYFDALKPLCRKYDLSSGEIAVLLFLANNPRYDTARDICNSLAIKRATVSLHVESLTAGGYLLSTTADGDRRTRTLKYTDAATPIIEEGRLLQRDFLDKMTDGLSAEELKTLEHCLTVFGDNLARPDWRA